MIASPETAACAGRPRWPWREASSATAPPTQKTRANAAMASAVARRRSDGRPRGSGKDSLQRHADDLEASGEPAEGELAQLVLGDAEHGRGVALAGQLQRRGRVRQQLAQGRTHRVGLLRMRPYGLAQEPD